MTTTTRRTWSISAAIAARTCPARWNYQYGPGKIDPAELPPPSLARRRGRILHSALETAYEHARLETANHRLLPGTRMIRYQAQARAAAGAAWTAQNMPNDTHEAHELMRVLTTTLRALPVPAAGTIYGIEQRLTWTTRNGLPVVAILDLGLWLNPTTGHLLIRDWKSRSVTHTDVLTSDQLLIGAAGAAASDHAVTKITTELWSLHTATGITVTVKAARIVAALTRLERTAARADTATEHPPTPGRHCVGCPFRRHCPAVT